MSSSVNDKEKKEYMVVFGILVTCLFLCTQAVLSKFGNGGVYAWRD